MYADRVSNILYYYDPANTSCKENHAVEEYDLFANHIVSEVEAGASVKSALESSLMYFFALDPEEVEEIDTDKIAKEIEERA